MKRSAGRHSAGKKRGPVCSGPALVRRVAAMPLAGGATLEREDRPDFAAAQADISQFAVAQAVELVDDGVAAAHVAQPAADAKQGRTEAVGAVAHALGGARGGVDEGVHG